ncbi:MAG: alpha-D-ribose 1-methylphosphonate 5-triphosphate diphosphatase [Desulfotalea sp.]
MDRSTYFINGQIVGPGSTYSGTILVTNGKIESIGEMKIPNGANVVDFKGEFLIPGLIELHTDNLEGELQPRPGVLWPSAMKALCAHDATIIGSGITTVLDSISCGQINEGKMRHEMFTMSLEAIKAGRKEGILRADHLLHLRCEICDPYVMEMFTDHVTDPHLKLVSLMDHTPGQRQFSDMAKYKQYYRLENASEEEFEGLVTKLRNEQAKFAKKSRAEIIKLCKENSVPLASHDDTTEEHVAEALAEGLQLSEFPTTIEAAKKAVNNGLGTIMGAPNVVRNGSHSGNVSARLLAKDNLLHILSSDYVPASLLHAAYILHAELGKKMHEALATVTANPAKFLGLSDRGEIKVGKRADLVRMKVVGDIPIVRNVWTQGVQVF